MCTVTQKGASGLFSNQEHGESGLRASPETAEQRVGCWSVWSKINPAHPSKWPPDLRECQSGEFGWAEDSS